MAEGPALTEAMEQAAQDLARFYGGADIGFCREVVAASLTAQAAPVRVQVAQLTGALPRPARWLLRVLSWARRLVPAARSHR
jgi:hypothetical protein